MLSIRDPVVLTATLPRFLLNGDRSTAAIWISTTWRTGGRLSAQGEERGVRVSAEGGPRALKLALQAAQRRSPCRSIGDRRRHVGRKGLVSGPGELRPRAQLHAHRQAGHADPCAPHRAVRSPGARASCSPATCSPISCRAAEASRCSVGSRPRSMRRRCSTALDRYPFGCSEQIASRALPLLYVNDLATSAHLRSLTVRRPAHPRRRSSGCLHGRAPTARSGLWRSAGDDAVARFLRHRLPDARARGAVLRCPISGSSSALDRLRNFVGNAQDPAKDGGRNLAYALYVLARNGAAPVGDLRYFADTKLDAIATPIAKAQIAAALGMLGDRARAERGLCGGARVARAAARAATTAAATMARCCGMRRRWSTLASEGGAPRRPSPVPWQRVEAARGRHAIYLDAGERVDGPGRPCAGQGRPDRGARCRRREDAKARSIAPSAPADTCATGGMKVTNSRRQPGAGGASRCPAPRSCPSWPPRAASRSSATTTRSPASPRDSDKAKQNDRFAVVLKIDRAAAAVTGGPSSPTICRPASRSTIRSLVSSGDTGALAWIEDCAEPVHSEFRDDRFSAAFQRKSGRSRPVFTVAYVVRAVSPGRYIHPQAYVETCIGPTALAAPPPGRVEVTAAK